MDEPHRYILSEITQTQKDKYSMFPLQEVPRVVAYTESENRMVVASRGRQGRNGKLLFNENRVQFVRMKMF